MPERIAVFAVGECYSSADIQTFLNVGNAGGVRACLQSDGTVRRLVVMTSVPGIKQAKENPYHDRMEGKVLVYTGAGREGNQTLAGVNKRLPHQLESDFPIYGFLQIGSRRNPNLGPKRWQFLGLLEYLRHYPETQFDVRRQLRNVWLFEFLVHSEPAAVEVSQDYVLSASLLQAAREGDRASAQDREVVAPRGAAAPGPASDAAEIELVRARLLSMMPERFEHLVKEVLLRTGFDRVAVTQYSQDGGIDVNAFASISMWPIRDLMIQIQSLCENSLSGIAEPLRPLFSDGSKPA
jgi:hypothetical protein